MVAWSEATRDLVFMAGGDAVAALAADLDRVFMAGLDGVTVDAVVAVVSLAFAASSLALAALLMEVRGDDCNGVGDGVGDGVAVGVGMFTLGGRTGCGVS